MSDNRGDDLELIAKLVLRYLDRNPSAADSAAGVQKWWIASQGYHFPKEMVELALQRMVSAGQLAIRDVAGQRVYRRRMD